MLLKARQEYRLQRETRALRQQFDSAPLNEILFKRIWETRDFSALGAATLSLLRQTNPTFPQLSNAEVFAYQYYTDWDISKPINYPTIARWLEKHRSSYPINALMNAHCATSLASTLAISPAPSRNDGVNLIGYYHSKSGLGEDIRLIEKALSTAGIAVNIIALPHISDQGFNPKAAECYNGELLFNTNLFCLSPLALNPLKRRYPELFDTCHNIAMLAWELPMWINEMEDISWLDEIWGISQFCTEAFKSVGVPCYYLPTPIDINYTSKQSSRVKDKPFTVLNIFDAASALARKNPTGLIEAFKQAFPSQNEHTRLIIKTINLQPSDRDSLLKLIDDDPRIVLIDKSMSASELSALYDSADVYLSLHRSEGLGRTIAEALFKGKVVIATNWSGSTELFSDSYPYLVDYQLSDVKDYPNSTEQQWAEPDMADAARLLRETFKTDQRELIRLIGSEQERLSKIRSTEKVGMLYRARLLEAKIKETR